jgi:DNA-binding LacI/PurR family transcriptional regulator
MSTDRSDAGRSRPLRRGRPGGTLAAVAAEVGVSRTTVSNAYNRPDQLSTELRDRIMAAAEQLGYAGPDPMARSLRTKQADAVGLIFTERLGYAFRDPAAVEFLHGLAEACSERGKSLLMVAAGPGAGHADTVARAAVDGFVMYSMPADDPHVNAVLSRPQPAVVVDAPTGMTGVDFVGIDDRAGFAQVAAHVLALGHRRIGVVTVRRGEAEEAETSPQPLVERVSTGRAPHPVRQQRLLGLLDAAEHARASVRKVVVAERDSNHRTSGALGTAALLDADPSLTAIVCTSDILAFGALDELAARGLSVPDDVTVTGFDDVPAAEGLGLTTVHQPLEQKGRAAIEFLLDERPRSRAKRLVFPTELVIRSSSGPVRR